jgi:membrane-associated phospholipid phosphatase
MQRYAVFAPWPLCILCLLGVAAISFGTIDVRAAYFFAQFHLPIAMVSNGLGSTILLACESALILTLLIVRLRRGRLSHWNEAVLIGCVVSVCAYAFNDGVLKPLFGVPSPQSVLEGGVHHGFHVLTAAGFATGFPSGHMALAAGFAGVLLRMETRYRFWLCALLLLGGATLVAGIWHFVSDVFAGTATGFAASYLATELWIAHRAKNPAH